MNYRFSAGAGVVAVLAAVIFSVVSVASAHVVVKPAQVGVGAFQTFTMGVPVEKDTPTVGLKLLIPAGLQYVMPNVKPGWKVTVKKEGDGEAATVTEIDWTGGSIPVGQRDEFNFSAKVPSTTTSIAWKAYQTYADGSIVGWIETPATGSSTPKNPYSQTTVINDLTAKPAASGSSSTALTFSLIALAFSLLAISMARKTRRVY